MCRSVQIDSDLQSLRIGKQSHNIIEIVMAVETITNFQIYHTIGNDEISEPPLLNRGFSMSEVMLVFRYLGHAGSL